MSYVLAQYLGAIKASERKITAEIEIDFPAPEGTQTFTAADIRDFSLLEESQGGSGNPLGFVTSNEFTLSLDNSSRRFTPSNPAKEFTVKPGLEVRPFLIIELSGVDARIPLGTFWTGEWSTHSDSVEAVTTAHDRLMGIINLDTPQIPPMPGTTVAKMFGRLFRAIGLEADEYIISSALTQPITVGWWQRNTVGKSMQTLAEAGNCFVSVNRDNKIVVLPNFRTADPKVEYDDTDMIFSINNPQSILDIFTAVKMQYRLPFEQERNLNLVRADNILIPPGDESEGNAAWYLEDSVTLATAFALSESFVLAEPAGAFIFSDLLGEPDFWHSITKLGRIDFHSEDVPVIEITRVHIYGRDVRQETWDLYLGGADGGTFTLSDGTTDTGAIAYDTNNTTIQSELETIYGAGEVIIEGAGGIFTITFSLTVGASGLNATFTNLTNAVNPYILRRRGFVGPISSYVESLSWGATDIILNIVNPSGVEEEVFVEVEGIGTGHHIGHSVIKDDVAVSDYGHKELALENHLIQSQGVAKIYSELLVNHVKDPLAWFEVEYRGDPLIEVGDIIKIESATSKIDPVDVMVKRVVLRYDGGLTSTLRARRVS